MVEQENIQSDTKYIIRYKMNLTKDTLDKIQLCELGIKSIKRDYI